MKTHSLLRCFAALGLVVGALLLSGCHTMEGAGKDIEKAGENIQDAADR